MLAVVVKSPRVLSVRDGGKSYTYCTRGMVVMASLHLSSNAVVLDETVQLYTSSPPGHAAPLTALRVSEFAATPVTEHSQAHAKTSRQCDVKIAYLG